LFRFQCRGTVTWTNIRGAVTEAIFEVDKKAGRLTWFEARVIRDPGRVPGQASSVIPSQYEGTLKGPLMFGSWTGAEPSIGYETQGKYWLVREHKFLQPVLRPGMWFEALENPSWVLSIDSLTSDPDTQARQGHVPWPKFWSPEADSEPKFTSTPYHGALGHTWRRDRQVTLWPWSISIEASPGLYRVKGQSPPSINLDDLSDLMKGQAIVYLRNFVPAVVLFLAKRERLASGHWSAWEESEMWVEGEGPVPTS